VVEGADSRHASHPPSSFHFDNSDEWGAWVLDHGLPGLPAVLGEDDEVPIAYWAGRRFGVVLFRSWWSGGDDEDQDEGVEMERDVNTDHYCYERSDRGWESTGGGGGVAGLQADPLGPLDLPSDFAAIGGSFQDDGIAGVTGLVGRFAAVLELTSDRDRVIRRAVEAPLNQFVVCFDRVEIVTVRILNSNGRPLLERTLVPGQF
jgi:hypothetical protein